MLGLALEITADCGVNLKLKGSVNPVSSVPLRDFIFSCEDAGC